MRDDPGPATCTLTVKQLAFEFAPPAIPSLDNFVAGRNLELLERLRALAARGAERFVYLWGAAGSGRTHLLRAALAALERTPARVVYLAGAEELPHAHSLEAAETVAADDVEQLDDAAQAALFNLYNRLRERGGTLIAAGDVPPARLKLRADLATRLAWGLVYEVHALTDEEKAQALAAHAASRGFTLQPSVCQYLLEHVQRDMRTLTSMLDSLDRYSLETKRPITVPLVRELLVVQ